MGSTNRLFLTLLISTSDNDFRIFYVGRCPVLLRSTHKTGIQTVHQGGGVPADHFVELVNQIARLARNQRYLLQPGTANLRRIL